MQYPDSFLGSRADALLDAVILSLAIIIPIVIYSWNTAKKEKFKKHRNTQIILFVVLAIVVYFFELDMKAHGGIFEMVKGSRYANTTFMSVSIYFHTFLSISTSLIWFLLIIFSLFKFNRNPKPNSFSNAHKLWGKIGMIDMILTGVTGVQLYIIGFVL